MAAILGNIKGKVLVQIGDGEPVEVGTIDIPIHAGPSPASPKGIPAQPLMRWSVLP